MTLHAAAGGAGNSADDIASITIRTHEAASASSTRKARSPIPADRDHCIQYMVAVPLLFGRLTAADYEDDVAADPRIDALRDKDRLRRGRRIHRATITIPTNARSPMR